MKKNLNRRDFLKIAGLLPFLIAPPLSNISNLMQIKRKNVLVIVFDAFSALDISLYGYGRETTPNLSRLAEKAIVYHNHYSGGNYTTPGTASLLTMTYPWTHRAIKFADIVRRSYRNKNVFKAFDDYYRIGYSHNPLANALLLDFFKDIDEYVDREKLFLSYDPILKMFRSDEDIATISWGRQMKFSEYKSSYSLYLSRIYDKYHELRVESYKDLYPDGPPRSTSNENFLLEDGLDWLIDKLEKLPQPFFSYMHFLPPHDPYIPRRDFRGVFQNDSFRPVEKPEDIFSTGNDFGTLSKLRGQYDEFILNVDSEFGRLFDSLETSGVLENTWLVLTSDHGEMQERGITGHITPTLYQPNIRIPLMIFEPGRQSRFDVYTPTNAVDVMTTLQHVTGHEIPDWSEGKILPPFGYPKDEGAIYTVQAASNDPALPLTTGTISQILGDYKLIYYFGYEQLDQGLERYQLFNIKSDPEELLDISLSKRETVKELLNLLKIKLSKVNEPFVKS